MRVTKEEIERQQTGNGGYSRATLAKWGVPWPPPKGWKRKLINGIEIQAVNRDAKPKNQVTLSLFD
jgi:hypothetical protein